MINFHEGNTKLAAAEREVGKAFISVADCRQRFAGDFPVGHPEMRYFMKRLDLAHAHMVEMAKAHEEELPQ